MLLYRNAGLRFAAVLLASVFILIAQIESRADGLTKNPDFTAELRTIIEINKPGYLNIALDPVTGENHLLVSSFQVFGKDQLFSISRWNQGLSAPLMLKTSILSSSTTWPNEARSAEPDLFNEPGLLIAGGFLVPGKSTGGISFIPWTPPHTPYELTTSKRGWFYHRTETWDVNEDGHLDIITARAYKPVIGEHKGELLWLENPGHLNGKWTEHLIGNGPDVHFRILAPTNRRPLTIISSEFSAKKLSAYQIDSKGSVQYIVLDDTLGSAFDVQIDDLNGDGQEDLLVSNHESDSKASVFGYEIDFDSLIIKARHTLITGIETKQKAIKAASPGPVTTFFPNTSSISSAQKPWILVSGDGSQKAHILVPEDNFDQQKWSYREHTLWNPKSTVGQSAVGDIDGDGKVEIFVPAYDSNQVAVFTIQAHQTNHTLHR